MTSSATSPGARDLVQIARARLAALGVDDPDGDGLRARSPISGTALFEIPAHDPQDVTDAVTAAGAAFLTWSDTPAPVRGRLVRRLGELLRDHQDELADLITLEAGKIRSEALGEVQEMVDICDFAVGLSRQLYGRTIASERPAHRLTETWHPLGVVGVISAFNFPAAVWSWNAAIALVCGDTVVWKPSDLTSLTALGVTELLRQACVDTGSPTDVHRLVLGGRDVGEALVSDRRVSLVSATGSTRMGAQVGPAVAARFGRSLLELGGNNASIVAPTADLDLAVKGIVFAAAGTAGQRCTSLRRLIVHADIADALLERLVAAYRRLPVGDPFDDGVLVGPLIHERAWQAMSEAIARATAQGAEVLVGGERVGAGQAVYVRPAIVRVPRTLDVVREETFAPVLWAQEYADFDDAIAIHNDVPQGLSSSIFTRDHAEAERFTSARGSDCGLVNVNIGTSGAEIGGAFGGEKETGGGRESGSDSWRAYMRRSTATVNFGQELHLAQNVSFLD